MKNIYFERYAWKESLFPNYKPDPDLELIVVIPCHNEPSIKRALISLDQCPVHQKFLVMVVVNEDGEDVQASVADQNEKTIREIKKQTHSLGLEILVSHNKFPSKKAGVGLARKVGMDEAARFFEQINKDGIIVCFDADCTCQTNYLQSILDFYQSDNECGIVFYEHRWEENREAIINYELHLRYYIDALRWCGFPYAYQTLGSCITVKSARYQKAGGMNTRKAGEDFYFLHKVIPNGKFAEINTTTIYPSGRISNRVPFGTGHAVDKYMKQDDPEYYSYHPKTFKDLKVLFGRYHQWFTQDEVDIPDTIHGFLQVNNFSIELKKIRKHSPNMDAFKKRFFDWMDAFRVLKYVHYARDHYYDNVPISDGLKWLCQNYLGINPTKGNPAELMNQLRLFDRKGIL